MKTGLIIGGTGRQGEAIVQFLSSTNQYHHLILTRNTTSDSVLKLAALPNVELVPNNTLNGYDVESFLSTASKSEFVFIDRDGFTLGEPVEVYWVFACSSLLVKQE
jgi:nucleoside-diphosphate-sugar epimerase